MFQSTPAHERATYRKWLLEHGYSFQSTPAHERATAQSTRSVVDSSSFNPRPLTSGRQAVATVDLAGQVFQSTPAHERATGGCGSNPARYPAFQSTPAHERATQGTTLPIA